MDSSAKDEVKQELQPRLLQRKANRAEAQSLITSDEVRGGKRGASIGEGWLRQMSGRPEKVQEVLLGFVANNTRARINEKKRNTFKEENKKDTGKLEKEKPDSKEKIQEKEGQIRGGQDNPENGDTLRSTQAPKYQIVYKSSSDKKSTHGEEGDKSHPAAVVPSPRGHKSFFDEEKIRKFKLLAQEKAPPPKLQFGFQPIKKKKKKGKASTFFGKSDYDGFLDSLQAPRVLRQQRPKSPAAPRKSKGVSKQDRKSNLDFLGIFDTRQYFYIPNRRSDEAKTKNFGVLAKIVRLFVGQ